MPLFVSPSTLGSATITTNSASTVGLTVKGAPSQAASLQEWQNSVGGVYAYVDATGHASFTRIDLQGAGIYDPASNNQLYPNGNVFQLSLGGATRSFAVQGAASQTADLQQWQDSSGNVLANINPDASTLTSARLTLNSTLSTLQTFLKLNKPNASWYVYLGAESIPYLYIGSGTTTNYFWRANYNAIADPVNTFQSPSATASQVVLGVKGAPSQTADLQQWQSSTGTVLASIAANGDLHVGGNGGNANVYDNGVPWFRDKDGTANGITLNSPGYLQAGNTGGSGNILILSTASATGTVAVRGYTAQTADLQQWQSSSGSVLAKVDASGNLILTGSTTNVAAISVTNSNPFRSQGTIQSNPEFGVTTASNLPIVLVAGPTMPPLPNSGILARSSASPGASWGHLMVGNAPFDNSTSGFFVGSANGTMIAVNAASGYTGNILDGQVAGVRKVTIDSSGNFSTTGGLTTAYASKAANYTMTASDSVIVAAAASLIITLPSAAAVSAGRVYKIKNNNQTTTTIKTSAAGQTIDGTDYSTTGYALNTAYGAVRLVSDGVSAWFTI